MTQYILGIETSCDDTAAAIVAEDGRVLSAVTASQIDIHAQYGGVFPELASRAHLTSMLPVVDEVFRAADLTHKDIKAIGVTRGPGLIGSLLVGLNTASALGLGWGIPVIGVNHLRGHLRSVDLNEKRVEYPAIILLVSGGHTFLAHMDEAGEITYLGGTRDDSVGEAYDKVGRMLDLPYPGGPKVDRLAKTGEINIPFPRPMLNEGLEFSFSGLKTAVSKYLRKTADPKHEDIAASFVDAVIDVLMTKCRRALKNNPAKSLVVVGGVAASPQLRAAAGQLCTDLDVKLCLPPLKWATDNAAMIGLAAWDYVKLGLEYDPIPQVRLPIHEY